MARKPNPARIYEARRAAIESRLARSRVLSPEDVERWLAAWEAEGARLGLDRNDRDYWSLGDEWIERQRHRKERCRERSVSRSSRPASSLP